MAMARAAVALCAAALVLCAAAAAAAAAAESGKVAVGTDENFAELLGSSKYVFVKFYAPWCGHCKTMAPAFVEAAEQLGERALLVEVDATEQEALGKQYDVTSFPQLKMFVDGEKAADYNGARDVASLVQFVENQWTPASVALADAAAVSAFLAESGDKHVALAFAAEGSGAEAAFGKLARRLRESVSGLRLASTGSAEAFAVVAGDGVAAEEGVVALRHGELGSVQTFRVSDGEAADAFVLKNTAPVLGELSQGTARLYQTLGLPLFLTFVDPSADNTQLLADLRAAAVQFMGKAAFVHLDGKALARFAEHIGLGSALPSHAVHLFADDISFPYKGEGTYAEFVQSYLDGKLIYKRKSEPVPASQDEAVHVVVGDTWESDVSESGKDVLVEQYAPWCGHCKTLAPIFEELAGELKHIDTVRLAKMDSTVNEAPSAYKARGFPTLHFFPAGKGEGMQYRGGRTKAELLKFIQENAVHKFDAPASDAHDDAHDDL